MFLPLFFYILDGNTYEKYMRCSMIRVILILLVVVVFLIVSVLPLLIGERIVWKNNEQRQKEYVLKVVKQVFHMVFRLTGSTLTVKGIENIPDGPVLYVGNHRSYFDIVTGYIVVPAQTGFIAKKEMEKIPLLRTWMRSVNCLFLDRKDIKAGLKTILEGIEKVKSGVSMWIFPEGTRCKAEDPTELLTFKEGSLKIAEKSGCPVVPVAITGTAEILEKHFPFIRPSHVTIEFGEPFRVKELPAEDRKRAGAYTGEKIREMLVQEQEERRQMRRG